jgi:hypothetical protein
MASDPRGARSGAELRSLAMIGVIADPAEHDVVREFFELFKTPWEFYGEGGHYDALLCSRDAQFDSNVKLVLCYSSRSMQLDVEQNVQTLRHRKHCILSYQADRIPIYGDTITFPEKSGDFLTEGDSRSCAAYLDHSEERVIARVGYDLFDEVRTLLTVGQPPVNANLPTLELHIALLRDLLTGCGLSLVEIPPVPSGYPFIACLTHDVDHPSVQRHKWDHTILGFLYRAVFGSLRKLIRGRISVRDLVRNFAAALKLPFVYLGLAKDFWRDFDDRYLGLEKDLPSTFFVIPFKNSPGQTPHGPAPAFRAARYEAQDIKDTIQKFIAAGREVGLHGIDAWLDRSKGRQEVEEVRRITGASEIGVRMHWLYQDEESPALLEEAGAAYDSTIGYNETVGYRSGATQVYKPLTAKRLLELPMHAMDTALFYPDHLGLSPQQAQKLLNQLRDNAIRFGGCLTINWHDRSLAPERLWGECYVGAVKDLGDRNAWFATAGQAVAWFRKRRAAAFETDCARPGEVRVRVAANHGNALPGLRLRIYKARELGAIGAHASQDYVDSAI